MMEEVQRFRFIVAGSKTVPKMSVCAFFIDGLLIDTGHSNAQKRVIKRLKDLPIEQICITHHHEDHTGNLKALQEQITCPIYGHELCTLLMKAPPPVCLLERRIWGKNTAVDNILPIEKIISTNRYQFHVIHTPGHADDHICLYEPQEGWLFSGDLYVHHYIRYFMATESVATQIASLKKVLKLNFDRFFCSHSYREDKGKERFQRKLQFLQDLYGNVTNLHQKGYKPSRIMRALEIEEQWMIRFLSGGWLSALNMINSVIRDVELVEDV